MAAGEEEAGAAVASEDGGGGADDRLRAVAGRVLRSLRSTAAKADAEGAVVEGQWSLSALLGDGERARGDA